MFIRYISHEIRNPLNSVQLILDSLEEDMRRNRHNTRRLEILRDAKASLQDDDIALDYILCICTLWCNGCSQCSESFNR